MNDISSTLAAKKYAEMAKGIADIKPVQTDQAKDLVGAPQTFGELVKTGVEQTIAAQRKSEAVSAQAVVGEAQLTDVVDAMTKAEVALDTVMAVRDRMLSTFQEIMRTQI